MSRNARVLVVGIGLALGGSGSLGCSSDEAENANVSGQAGGGQAGGEQPGGGQPGGASTGAPPTAGAPNGSGGGGAGGNTGEGGRTTAGGSATVGGGAGAGAAGGSGGAPAFSITLALFNTVTARIEPGFEAFGPTLERVELPPRYTFSAQASSEVKAVRFNLDGKETLDATPPFRLNEDTMGKPSAWPAVLGKHTLRVTAYRDTAATLAAGTPRELAFELKGTGTDTAFVPTDAATNTQWVNVHLDEVMKAKTFMGTVGKLPYRLFTPAKYDASVSYPLLVFLHGRGDRGTDNRASIYSSELFHGARSIVAPNQQAEFPSFVLVPQCSDMPDSQEWARWTGALGADGSYQQAPDPWPSALLVQELIASLLQTQKIDARRIYLAGESMGGFGAWEFTTRWPSTYAAGVPMAGYSDRSKVARILEIPFWVFHGGADQSNPVAGSRAMTKAINDAGGSAKYTEYPGVDHVGTFRRAWSTELELLPFIFSQRRAK